MDDKTLLGSLNVELVEQSQTELQSSIYVENQSSIPKLEIINRAETQSFQPDFQGNISTNDRIFQPKMLKNPRSNKRTFPFVEDEQDLKLKVIIFLINSFNFNF